MSKDADSWSAVAARVRERAGERDDDARVLHPAVLRLFGRLQGRRMLDVACGSGALVRVLSERGALVVGVDASPDRVRAAERRAAEARLDPQPEFLVGDLAAPGSLPAGPFDAITALLVLEPADKEVPRLRSLVRLLRPGGRLVLAFPHPYAGGDLAAGPLESLFRALREVGLRVADIVEPASEEPLSDEPPSDPPARRRFLVVLCERRRRRPRNRQRSR